MSAPRVTKSVSTLAALLVLVLGCDSEPAGPTGPVAVEAPCEGPGLAFAPSGRYRVEIRERDQTYRSTLTFDTTTNGWAAIERDLSVEPATDALGELSGAELRWTLDEDGVPLEPPVEASDAHPGVLQNLTVFAFRPTGLTMDPVCEGVAATRRWVDGMERVRTVSFQIAQLEADAVTFTVRSTIETAVNEWQSEGRVTVSRADGFTGEAELAVTGPGGQRYERRVTVARAP